MKYFAKVEGGKTIEVNAVKYGTLSMALRSNAQIRLNNRIVKSVHKR